MTPVVVTSGGAVRGLLEDGLAVFRGIPYAAPPVDDLRWRRAQSHPGWTDVRDATRYGPSAPQPYLPGGASPILGEHGSPPFDEDCLTLNVWTPGLDGANRPVLVWIHGGGFTTGSGSIPYYAGDTFARNGNLVVVTINYRLGAFGYLHGMVPGHSNLWLSDQAAALNWIAENAAAFGGDPNAITLMGQSGGGFSIGALAQHPTAAQQFHRAIVQSAPLGLDLPTPEEAAERTDAVAVLLGHADCRGLAGEPTARLVEGTVAALGRFAEFGTWNLAFSPVLDDLMSVPPRDALADPRVELLIGWTEDEGTFPFATDPRYDTATADDVVAVFGKRHQDPGLVYRRYADALGDDPRAVLSAECGDRLFKAPARDLLIRRAGTGNTYAYEFALDAVAFAGALGATHCLELPFTFANPEKWAAAPFLAGLDPDTLRSLGTRMHRSWISFVRNGKPETGSLHWPASDGTTVMVLDADSKVATVRTSPV
ncbi:carboxylesterase/lipase family protein [Sciscionella marina]|uniref:carboxylesterase/lipase family protein n=1 Tax=Sciscionella marina TaxID=508770 RepID=UPI00037764B5|nr:carboxylesterase family protein [Sciscionella marina]